MWQSFFGRSLAAVLASAALLVVPSGASPAAAQATVVSSNVQVPYTADRLVPCAFGGAGEIVHVDGRIHIVTYSTVDARGGLHDIEFSLNGQGVTGVGLTSGTTYRGTGGARTHTNAGGASAFEAHLIDTFRLIGPGPGNNFMDHFVVHVTVNANGTTTAMVDYGNVTCG